ncbi:outer membrane beta-barrel protein [Halanaerobacter jeridensis]|uniref:Porin n=1 Tax=Halanaerobacter jeridensis TaxID=706427 RepID=A0A938XV91_9FIRM|nr:outer membrane beta-barrel protein [Halanaerobacter jeridensis]MBM7556217.1 putative porin [Halanaerobacter jeridensis]
MKKYILILLILLSFNCSIEAKEITDKKIEFNGGLTYNNYIYKKYDLNNGEKELDEDYFIREDLHHGQGFYTEVIYWLNKKLGIELGLQKNEMKAEWDSENNSEKYEYKSNLDTYYSGVTYKVNPTLELYIDANYNFYQEHYSKSSFSTDIKSGEGLGFMIGTKVNYQINKNFDVILNTEYYLAEIDIDERYSSYQGKVINVNDEELKISGLGLKLGIGYKF